MQIKVFLFGSACFNYALSMIYNGIAVGLFKDKKSEFAIFIFGNIYFIMIFHDGWFFSSFIWKLNITANCIGAAANLLLHRKIDTFWWLNLNDCNKAIIFSLIIRHLSPNSKYAMYKMGRNKWERHLPADKR